MILNPLPRATRRPAAPVRPGFTLIELLVAISVLSLMMTLATRIFFDAQQGVQRGLQTSQIIAESRSISQPLAADFRNMHVFESKFGGNTPGFLIIAQNWYPDVLYPIIDDPKVGPDGWTADRDGDGNAREFGGFPGSSDPTSTDDLMRSDQIAFMRSATNLESLTPGADQFFDSQTVAKNARVWLGHTSPPVDTDGDLQGFEDSLDPGDPDYNLASQMVLGRQALLLVENDAATKYPSGDAGDTGAPGPPPAAGSLNRLAVDNSVREATYGGIYDTLDLRQLGPGTYGVYDDQGVDPTTGSSALFRTPSYLTPQSPTTSLFGEQLAATGQPLTPLSPVANWDYARLASDWMYLPATRRLQARTFLEGDFSAGIFTADEVAQLHAAFAPHVADFATEFAADWIDDLDADGLPGTDGQPDNEPDRDGAGNIIWYTTLRPNPDDNSGSWPPSNNAADYDGVGNNFPDEPVTYAIPNSDWVSTFDGTTTGPGSIFNPYGSGGPRDGVLVHRFNNHNVIIFSHTGDDPATDASTNPPDGLIEGCGKYWPYLIRFRFRLMDGKGEFRTIQTNPFTGEDYPVVGRWFEQIVPVPRPQGLY